MKTRKLPKDRKKSFTVGFVHSMGPKFGKGDGRRCIRGLGTMEHRLRAGSSGVRCGHARSLLAGGRLLPARMAWLGKVLTRRSRSGCPAVARLNTGWGKSENCRKFCGEIRHQAPKTKVRSTIDSRAWFRFRPHCGARGLAPAPIPREHR